MPDCSFGIVPFRIDADTIRLLLVWETYGDGHWNFPKGHAEGDETPIETALRELFEETRLDPKEVISDKPLVQEYSFEHEGREIQRRLEYFVALVGSGEVKLQLDEVTKFRWMTLKEVIEESPFPELHQTACSAHSLAVAYKEALR
jgi:bis(5'-nucleosidyl)-tetraphosphatase